jgi:hypothetical protein
MLTLVPTEAVGAKEAGEGSGEGEIFEGLGPPQAARARLSRPRARRDLKRML